MRPAQDEARPISSARTAGLLLVSVAWAGFLGLIGSPEAILFTAPLFLLAAPLALGRYVGESLVEVLLRAVERPDPAEGRRPRVAHARERVAVQGGLLLGRRMAERAPPFPRIAHQPI